MMNSVAALWPDLDDTLSDDEVIATSLAVQVPPDPPPAAPLLDPKQQLISVVAASRYLGRSVPTLHRWVRQGRLPAVKIGRSTLLRVSDVEAFILAGLFAAMWQSCAAKQRGKSPVHSRASHGM